MTISNLIFIISAVFILWSVKYTLNKHYGQICDIALRQKIVDDIIGIMFFSVSMAYMIKKSMVNILLVVGIIVVYGIYVFWGAKIYEYLKKVIGTEKSKEDGGEVGNKEVTVESHMNIYKETIFLAIILFCRRTVFGFLIIEAMSTIAEFILILIGQKTKGQSILGQFQFDDITVNILFIFSIVGLAFSIKKYLFNKKMNSDDKDDNTRYYRIVNMLERKEHDI